MMSQAEPNTNWKPLYRVGGAAALITAVLIPLQIVVFVAWSPPFEGAASKWFALFQDNAHYVPTIGVFLSVISVPVLWIWYILIGRRLIQPGSGVSEEAVEPHQT